MDVRPQEAAFLASFRSLPTAQLVPELRRVLAAARPLPYYAGSPTLAVMTHLVARELSQRGFHVEALPLFREALAELTTTRGADHITTLHLATSLGTTLNTLGHNGEARSVLERVLARQTQLLGEAHPSALFTLGELANVLRELANLDGAETLLQRGTATLKRLAVAAGLAPDAPPPGLLAEWGHLNYRLAKLLIQCRRYEDAETLLRQSLATFAALPTCDQTSSCVQGLTLELANVLQVRGDCLGAEKMFKELLPKLHGKHNYSVVARNYGMLLHERGLVTEARKYLDIAQESDSTGYGADSIRTLSARWLRSRLDAPLRTCAQCGPVADATVVMKVCQGCHAARYCSSACAGLHWKAHKKECRRIKAENEAVAAGSSGAGPST